jgi:predicted DNA-binding transcriptional regulator YafY
MPRNDQITRQWHLLRRLEGSTGLTPRGLVESVPEDYPKNARTVRRDLEALEAVGFPIVTDRQNGQTRWKLMDGFHDIPALGFSATELMALLLSRNLLKPLAGTEIAESLDSALSKASAALPPQGHDYIRAMEQIFPSVSGRTRNTAHIRRPSTLSRRPSTKDSLPSCATTPARATTLGGARSIRIISGLRPEDCI